MPTIWVKHQPSIHPQLLDRLAEDLPRIASSQINVEGAELHEGGVGEEEIMIEFMEFSPRDRNVNDIQITMIAHTFSERQARLNEATSAITEGVGSILDDFAFNVKIGVSIWLVEMGYQTT